MSCIGFTNPTQRKQIASKEACEAKLSWPVPEYVGRRRTVRLSEQALSPSYEIRAIAAAHPDLPQAYVLLLSMDSSREVRRHIAMRKVASKDMLERMYGRETDPAIKQYLRWRLDKLV
jgi:hypothetical protein